jgi:hypothetical protein
VNGAKDRHVQGKRWVGTVVDGPSLSGKRIEF